MQRACASEAAIFGREVLSAAYIPDDDRLSCIVEAGCVEDVHRLFGVALLPSVRVVRRDSWSRCERRDERALP